MYAIEQKTKDIEALLNECVDAENDGRTEYFGMTYEQGIKAGIEWLTTKDTDRPL